MFYTALNIPYYGHAIPRSLDLPTENGVREPQVRAGTSLGKVKGFLVALPAWLWLFLYVLLLVFFPLSR
jgi:hypothetical protein